ncbi:MAG: hypothetical protein ACJAT2_002379 [Bacteriovoracaceae bacterium]|jgi:hypothetical protein
MINLLSNYIYAFLHPFKTHTLLSAVSDHQIDIKEHRHFQLVENISTGMSEADDSELHFVEAMSISWIFIVIQGIYSLFAIHLGYQAFSMVHGEEEGLTALLIPNFHSQGKSLVFWGILLQIVFFPLFIWFYTRLWGSFIKFFADLFEVEERVDQKTNQVINHSLVSYTFLILPVFGSMAQGIGMLFYLYAGLKNNFKFSHIQSLVILVSPVIFLGFTFILLLVMVLMVVISL